VVLLALGAVTGVALAARSPGHTRAALAGAGQARNGPAHQGLAQQPPQQPTTTAVPTTMAVPTTVPATVPVAPPTSGVATVTPAPVKPMGRLFEADALVSLPATAAPDLLQRIVALPKVQAAELVDTGTVQLAGGPAATLGVDPNSFRNFTPRVTAASDQLWSYVAGGSLASSFDMARDRKLGLGATVPVVAAGANGPGTPSWLGAFLSVGLPGIDLVVDRSQTPSLRLNPGMGVVISAPNADAYALQTALRNLIPKSDVELIRPGIAIGGPGGSYLTPAQMSTVVAAALSRVGAPYVWGATGPNGFDCSGLMGWAFNAAGISLPRTAAQQALAGPQIPLNQVRPGDLLFWAYDSNDPTFIDHVAMYLGDGKMVVAPQTGELVQVAPVPTAHLVGAIRVNPAAAARVGGPRWQ
jgi:hypothetical protein